jgi:hypothetical protein
MQIYMAAKSKCNNNDVNDSLKLSELFVTDELVDLIIKEKNIYCKATCKFLLKCSRL